MNALRALAVALAVAVSAVLSSGGAVQAANTPDYEGTTVATYSFINAWWPNKYPWATAANPGNLTQNHNETFLSDGN
jgi:hypothetical protein